MANKGSRGAANWPHHLGKVVLVMLVSLAFTGISGDGTAQAPEDAKIAQNLAEMLRDARAIISDNQGRINDPEIGDKRLSVSGAPNGTTSARFFWATALTIRGARRNTQLILTTGASTVPEPGPLVLLLSGLGGIVILR